MNIIVLLLTILSLNALAYTGLSDWNVCQGEVCKEVKAGDDLYLKHGFKDGAVTYSTQFNKNQLSCFSKNDCWLFLGSVGDSAIIKLNSEIIGKFEGFIHHQSLKLSVPSSLIQDQNEIEIIVNDLNQTRFGLRSPEVGIGVSEEVTKLTNKDWLLRTGSTLLSAFTLFVLLLGMIATYGIYKNRKILPLIGLTGIGLLYLISFSEIPRTYLDPVFMSGPVHFTLRLGVELAVVLVALSFYTPNSKINFLKNLPTAYIFAILPMVFGGLLGHNEYAFYKTVMLIVAPLVVGGGLTLSVLSYFYYDRSERFATFPIFLGLLSFQIYDLVVFWELIPGSFTIKWYLPFLTIVFSWIYFRRRINEVRSLKIEAIIGDEVRKLSHDIATPIQALKSQLLSSTSNSDLAIRTIESLEAITTSILHKYESNQTVSEYADSNNLNAILNELKENYKNILRVDFELSSEFDWYCVDYILFKRIFSNLINNSINAFANTVVFRGQYLNNELQIFIQDNGCGIDFKMQPYIFDKGVTSNSAKGSGLGLNFIKEKLGSLGYTFNLSVSRPGETIFIIKIPIKELILIDDNEIIHDTWNVLSKKLKINLKSYVSSETFYKSPLPDQATPIFIDYNLGDENGYGLAKALKQKGYLNVFISSGQTNLNLQKITQVNKSYPLNIRYQQGLTS